MSGCTLTRDLDRLVLQSAAPSAGTMLAASSLAFSVSLEVCAVLRASARLDEHARLIRHTATGLAAQESDGAVAVAELRRHLAELSDDLERHPSDVEEVRP
ncbi:hypothetical protein AB0J74_21595 [Asanoa sp. NPDC049573]|uniref:hypothetical protein n=1 Tax=Asanoa sp. NPDC049573 TaxID=3155396 RepID=UPI00341C975F